MTKYTADLYQTSKVVRPAELEELDERISKGIYQGGLISAQMGKAYDDNDLLKREILQGRVRREPVSAILLVRREDGDGIGITNFMLPELQVELHGD